MIREKGNGFVKLDEETGIWVEAAELVAREKVGQCMRNILSSEFKSSFRNKKQRRKLVTANLTQKLHSIVMSDPFVSTAMRELEGNILKQPETSATTMTSNKPISLLRRRSSTSTVGSNSGDYINDKEITYMFKRNNALLLEHFKRNPSLEQRFRKTLVAYSTRQQQPEEDNVKEQGKQQEQSKTNDDAEMEAS